jgi:transposase-like protein
LSFVVPQQSSTGDFNAGVTQETLAAEHRISIRSVKRLVHGASNRPEAVANRLTNGQRDTIIHRYASTGATQAELARDYDFHISTIKRILREARNTEPATRSPEPRTTQLCLHRREPLRIHCRLVLKPAGQRSTTAAPNSGAMTRGNGDAPWVVESEAVPPADVVAVSGRRPSERGRRPLAS